MSDQPFHQRDSTQSTRDVAVEETRSVGHDAKESARHVAQTAGSEAQAVVGEAKAQVTSLYEQVRQDVSGQARDQTQRAASGLHGLAGEFTQMADGASGSGMASGLARQAAQRIDAAAGWLDGREPSDLLEDVSRYARRNPGTFLAACAVIGLVGGRLTRGLRDDAQEGQGTDAGGASTRTGQAAGSVPAPQPLEFDTGYGGRPGAAPEGSIAAGTTGGAAMGTAAGNPIPAGPGHDDSSTAVEGTGTAPIVAGDGEDVYTDPDDLAASEPWADAPELGQGGVDGSTQELGGGQR